VRKSCPMDFASVASTSLSQLLVGLRVSVAVTTYQSGRVIVVRGDERGVNTHLLAFESPMGIAVRPDRFALGTKQQIWDYRNQPAVVDRLEDPARYDACYIPRAVHWTGDIGVHELVWAQDELHVVSTAFSCLATVDADHSFVPYWRPPFVSAYSPDDRCHLNGVGTRDGAVRYVTALGRTDVGHGWRENKLDGGVLMEVPGGEVVSAGLCMPHSPRWHGGRLWVLESGKAALNVVAEDSGRTTVVAQVPGFARGLAFAGPYAFIGLSQVRESVFAGLPITQIPDRSCGLWVIDTRSGATVAFLRFEGDVQEIFDVQLIPARYPEVLEADSDLTKTSYVLPDVALADVAGR
jgi:uncharacterized protein (TIGR03032 family)